MHQNLLINSSSKEKNNKRVISHLTDQPENPISFSVSKPRALYKEQETNKTLKCFCGVYSCSLFHLFYNEYIKFKEELGRTFSCIMQSITFEMLQKKEAEIP